MNEKLYEKLYEKLTRPIRNYPYGVQILNMVNKLSTLSVYLIYIVSVWILAFHKDRRFWKVTIGPAIFFVLISIFRSLINFPRPYEVFNIDPIIKKDTKGKSFPSRHVFSAFIIAVTLYYISVPVGTFLIIISIFIAIVRVLGGVHFPRDVVFGALIGILLGVIGWNYLI